MQKKLSFSSKTTSPLYSQRAYFLFLTRGGCFESQRATTLMFSTDMSVQNLMSLESLKIEIAEKETVRVCQSACVRAKVCICVWVGVCEGERERETKVRDWKFFGLLSPWETKKSFFDGAPIFQWHNLKSNMKILFPDFVLFFHTTENFDWAWNAYCKELKWDSIRPNMSPKVDSALSASQTMGIRIYWVYYVMLWHVGSKSRIVLDSPIKMTSGA